MKEFNLWDALAETMVRDEWHQRCMEAVEDAEGDYLVVRDALTEEQRERLDNYLAACEALDDSLVHLAYKLGQEHGKIVIFPSEKE